MWAEVRDSSVALRERFPQLSGKVILQDIPQTLMPAIHHDSAEVMERYFQSRKPSKVRIAAPQCYYSVSSLIIVPT